MKISRQVGTTNEILQIFVQDATVSTGAGLSNLSASSFSSYWCRNDQSSTSSIVLASSAASSLGLYASGKWLQVNSTFMQGWYQLSVPDGVFASSRSVGLHLYGNPSMAPVPVEIELTRIGNQEYISSFVISSLADKSGYGVSSISVGVSTSWFSGGTILTSVAGILTVNVSTIQTGNAVTTAAGTLGVGRVGVSSFGLAVGVSSFDIRVGVSSMNIGVAVTTMSAPVDVTSFSGNAVTVTQGKLSVDVSTFFGSRAVTTAAGTLGVGRVGVSSFDSPVGVSSFGIRVGVSSFNSPVGVSSFDIPVGVSSLSVGVSTSWFSGGTVVTSAAGVLASHVTSMRIAIDEQIADSFLARNIAGGSDGGRSVTEAMYFLRNRSEISGTLLTVYQTDDTTSSWEATISTAVGNPVVSVDPA